MVEDFDAWYTDARPGLATALGAWCGWQGPRRRGPVHPVPGPGDRSLVRAPRADGSFATGIRLASCPDVPGCRIGWVLPKGHAIVSLPLTFKR